MTGATLIRTILLLTILACTLGCQTTRETLNFDTSIEMTFKAATSINPDLDNRASPLVIRIFKLSDARQFSREDFLNLYEDADNRLGKDLINTVVLKEIAPGETRTEELELDPSVKYIGLLAEFVQYQDADAITVIPVQSHTKNELTLSIDGITLSQKKR